LKLFGDGKVEGIKVVETQMGETRDENGPARTAEIV